MSDFTNKIVVITGGSSGIGKAIAEKFDQQGAKVVIFGRDQHKLNQVCKTLRETIAVQGDVRNIADIEKLFKHTHDAFGKIDVLIANAGIASRRFVQEVDERFFDDIVATNYKGVYFTVQRSIPHLNAGASVVLISSTARHIGCRNHSVYSSAKAAVSMLARSFAADLVDRGIRVNAISPGFTDTPLFDSVKDKTPHLIAKYTNDIPLKRFATASEVAEAALFLSSPKAAYIVGTDLVIDGGVSSIYPL
jgi:NAD(P)-dependent dehydrogenase (short-subunit alcohol dehydrogenase family)